MSYTSCKETHLTVTVYNYTSVRSDNDDPDNIIYEQYALEVPHGKAYKVYIVMAKGKESQKKRFYTLLEGVNEGTEHGISSE